MTRYGDGKSMAVAILCIALAGCASSSSLSNDVAALEDRDVIFDGGWLGLQAQLSARAQRVAAQPGITKPMLLKALGDDRRFIAAHVILTSFEKPLIGWWPTFNGLDLECSRDIQHAAVLARWSEERHRGGLSAAGQPIKKSSPSAG